MKSPFRVVAPLLLSGLALSFAACSKENAATSEAPAAAAQPSGEPGAPLLGVAGLDSERAEVSYMIGLDVAKSLEPIKGDIDVEMLAKAMSDTFAGADKLMNDEQATRVREAFTVRIQAKQQAEQAAKAEANLKEGEAFLAANKDKPGVKTTESGLQYLVLREGSGAKPAATDRVKVHYRGTLLDGTEFDSSYERGQPAEFGLNQVIPGWSEGVALMPVGSKYQFWIPAALGYGESGGGPIGPNAMLTFEVELIEIVAGN